MLVSEIHPSETTIDLNSVFGQKYWELSPFCEESRRAATIHGYESLEALGNLNGIVFENGLVETLAVDVPVPLIQVSVGENPMIENVQFI